MTLTHKRLVNKMIAAYVDWREACRLVNEAYSSWASTGRPGAKVAFGTYSMALDREERAAEVYAGLARRVGHLVAIPAALVGDAGAPARKAR